MNIRTLLLSSVAGAGLLFAISHVPQALAQKGTFLSPSSQWAVTKVAGNLAAGQAGYCAVAKRYEGNAILTIARNQGTETSFALDLQKPAFNTAKLMKVTLDPGAGEQRDYSISPASQQAFVVRLGRDEAFFDAIDRTGFLRVEVEDESYVFNISDIGAGQSKLNSCLASAVEPAAGKPAPVNFKTDVTSNSNKEFIAELKQRIQSLENTNNSLEAKIVEAEMLPPLSVSSVPDDTESIERVEALRAENLRLKAALQTGEVELRDEKLDLLEADNKRLAADLARQTDVSSQVRQLQARIDNLLSENARLKQGAASSFDEEVSSLQKDIESLEAENSSLKVALTKHTQGAGVVEQLRERISHIENENRVLKDKHASLPSSDADIEALRVSHAQEVEALHARVEELRLAQRQDEKDAGIIENLNGELASLRADNLLLQQELHEKSVVEPSAIFEIENVDIAALEFENKKLQSELDKASETYAIQDKAIVALEAENKTLQNQLAQVDLPSVGELDEKLEQVTESLAKSEAKLIAQEEKLAALAKDNAGLKQALDEKISENLTLANAADNVSALKEQIAEKDAKLAQFDKVPERLKALLDNYKIAKAEKERLEKIHAGDAVKLEELAALEQDNAELQKALDEKVAENLTLADAALTVETLQSEVAVKEEKLSKLDGVAQRFKDLLGNFETVKAEKEQLALENSQMRDVEDKNINLTMQLASAEERNASLETSIQKLQGQVAEMAQLNEDVKTLNLALVEKEQELQQLASLRTELSQLVAENAALKGDAMTIAAAVDGERANADALAEENIALRESLSSVIAKVEGQNEIIAQHENNISSVVAKNEALKGQLDLAAQLMASNDAAVAEVPLQQKVAQAPQRVERQEEAKVILASVSPEMPKPSVKPERRVVQDDASFAERLAQIEPAAGPESVDVDMPEQSVMADVIETPEVVEEAQDFMDRDLNQAQIYEEQLKRSLQNKEIIAESRKDPIDVETLEDGLIEPQGDIDAVIEEAAAPELPPLDDDVTLNAEELAVDSVKDNAPIGALEDAQQFTAQQQEAEAAMGTSDVAVKMSQDPFEGIAVEGEDQRDSDVASVAVSEPVDAMPKQVKQPVSSPVAMTSGASGGNAVERVLSMANVSGVSSVNAVAEKAGAYQWRAGSLFGSGEQREMNSSVQFDGFVKDYLTKTEARCPGEFAVVPDNSKESGSMRVDSYEIACVGSNVSSSASLVFYNEGNIFTVLAHETEADQMAQAMAVRDQIFTTLAGGRDS